MVQRGRWNRRLIKKRWELTARHALVSMSRRAISLPKSTLLPQESGSFLRFRYDIYARREAITPRYVSQAGLKVIEILRLLPMTNCKACGYASCMAYAAALREGEIRLEDCPPLGEEKFREKQAKLQAYLERFG